MSESANSETTAETALATISVTFPRLSGGSRSRFRGRCRNLRRRGFLVRYSPPQCIGAVATPVSGNPDRKHISTSFAERQNLNLRMGVRRFTRLTNAFGNKLANQVHALALYYVFYNFCRIHKTLRMTSATASGVSNVLYDIDWIVGLIDAHAPKPQKPGAKPGAKYRPRKRGDQADQRRKST